MDSRGPRRRLCGDRVLRGRGGDGALRARQGRESVSDSNRLLGLRRRATVS